MDGCIGVFEVVKFHTKRHRAMEMHEHFSEIPRPTTTSELEDQVAQAFLLLTGLPMSTPESFRVERFAHGGISSGFVSPGFWRGRAMALIKKRYAESQ